MLFELASVNLHDLTLKLTLYFPYYVLLVLVPMLARAIVERAAGIMLTASSVDMYDVTFREFVYSVLFFPLFEELIFRGLPFILFGNAGLYIGSAVWVAMHPAWQLQYLYDYPLSKKILFTVTCTGYYASVAVFFTLMWLNGDGLCAVLYHMFHNMWLTLLAIKTSTLLDAEPIKAKRFVRHYVKRRR